MLSDHLIERNREGPVPAHLNRWVELVDLVHLDGQSLRAKSSISLSECGKLRLQRLDARVGGINQSIFESLWLFHIDSHGELVA